jgi:hypothetical protein
MRALISTVAAIVAASTWYLFDGRYSWLPAGKEGYALRVDRLTGTVLKCGTAGCADIWLMSGREAEGWRPAR